MADLHTKASTRLVTERLIPVVLAAVVYLAIPELGPEAARPPAHFSELAQAFLRGELTIEIPPSAGLAAINELIPADDLPASRPGDRESWHFYCAYPPLPAVLLIPFVAIAGAAVKVEVACRVVSVFNVMLFGACLYRLPRKLGRAEFSAAARNALTLLFGFGTVCWHNAEMGGDWHLAHAVALTAMLLALREHLNCSRPFVVGCLVGLAVLTRPTAALSGLFFAMPLLRSRAVPQLVKLAAGPLAAALLLALYNNARFGSPVEFGYERMLLRGAGAALIGEYGQFDVHFVPRNIFWFFLAPPWPLGTTRLPFLEFDPHGMGLFFATPALIYVFAGMWRGWRCPAVRDASLGILASLIPLLTYFNTGYAQFGHRFSMDYMPLLMVLLVAGMGDRPGKLAYVLVGVSIVIQAVGVLLGTTILLPLRPTAI